MLNMYEKCLFSIFIKQYEYTNIDIKQFYITKRGEVCDIFYEIK